ncbi:hypothetical protein LCGC14_1186660 [marine sediment metagenome]|uniref:Uncharacterized protein n=1 Tax=marine sediment metagenome TaxID=412755 RepID=A0A0F9LQD0_9ZZZZ
MTDERLPDEILRDMQSLIDFLGAHPELPLPKSFDFAVYELGVEDLDLAKTIAKALGTFDKETAERFFSLIKRFGRVSLRFVFYRDNVCTKRVIGTKQVTEMVPAPGAKMVERTVETEIVEWNCPSLLADDEASTA